MKGRLHKRGKIIGKSGNLQCKFLCPDDKKEIMNVFFYNDFECPADNNE